MNNIEKSEDLSAPPPGVSGGGPYAIFQNRDFTFYLVSRLVGITGQQMFTLAILWEICGSPNRPWRSASWGWCR